jgi:type VI protein secretion system component Hcp
MKLILILRNQVSIEQQSIPLDTTRFPYTKIKITYKNQFQINTMLEDQMRRKQIEGSK